MSPLIEDRSGKLPSVVLVPASGTFRVVLAARGTALATGAFWRVGAVVATTAAGPAATSRALGRLLGGAVMRLHARVAEHTVATGRPIGRVTANS